MLASGPASAAERTLTYAELLGQLTDLDRLTHLRDGITAGQFSSWDRGERERWGTNGDAGHYLRVEDDGEAVMVDVDGPGCIYRVWSANPQGTIRLYFGGEETPTEQLDFKGLFTGENPPFVPPLVYKRGGPRSASDCYLPIPFSDHLKVTADQAHGQFYIFDYLRFPEDWRVPNFRLPLSDEEEQALERAVEVWSSPGEDPKPRLDGQTSITRQVTVAPGGTIPLAELDGPGLIRAIRAEIDCEQRYFWRKLVLRGTWDGAARPQVLCPVGPFFGFDWYTAEYGSVPAGCRDGRCYFFYPMPFHRSATLELVSHLQMPATAHFEIEWAPQEELPEDTCYFFARWRHEPRSDSFDYPFIETAGRGHLVGVSLQIDHPVPGWWGEGDEKVWVDDDGFPQWIGTGSEDYFGDAWGIRYLPGPSFGCSLSRGHRTCPYRWHFMDLIPFTRRLRMTIENYPPYQEDYASVAYWYQAERVPPMGRLRGQTYIGGRRPGDKPRTLRYDPSTFTDITPGDLLTYGRAVPYAVEAEEAVSEDQLRCPGVQLMTDAGLPHELNWERALYFGRVSEGQRLADLSLYAPRPSVYTPTLYCYPRDDAARLTLQVRGAALEVASVEEDGRCVLEPVYLDAGGHSVELVAATSGRAVLDCVQLQEVAREENAIEAETLTVVSVSPGSERPHPSPPWSGVSAGRVLEWHANREGASVRLRIPGEPDRPYVLGLRPMFGPGGAIIQAFEEGQPASPQYDLYAPEKRPAPGVLPLGQLPPDRNEVEIRVVGKNREAKGYHAGFDYFRFEPLIIHPDSAGGVWARVLQTHQCDYRIQNLGGEWLGGHHLWVTPSREGAMLDIALNLPQEATWRITVRYTTSWDYAVVQATLDDQPLGGEVDCYTPEVRMTDEIVLGSRRLEAGQHTLRFTAVGSNPQSRGHLMGIDYIRIERAD
ncbi:MAG: glycoside hydrolase family 172 protein [Armatimonadota bacterium]|nr:glycoside hydrolase family 172 protein [Armatimonadota bacterium]